MKYFIQISFVESKIDTYHDTEKYVYASFL